VVSMGSWARMRMWLLAIAVAILGTHALQLAGLLDLPKSFYVRPNLTWLSYILGGSVFGVGMTLGSGCGSKAVARLGRGSLVSVVVVAFYAIAAYMTLQGLFPIRSAFWIDPVAVDLAARGLPAQGLPRLVAVWPGGDLGRVEHMLATPVAAGL